MSSTYGPVSGTTVATFDLIAPGMPVILSAIQVNNRIIRTIIVMPVMDANGDNLSGLTKLTIASIVIVAGVNPFEGKTMTEILAIPGIQKVDIALTMDDAGQQKTADILIQSIGSTQAIAAACAD